jgi:hypothetical protein
MGICYFEVSKCDSIVINSKDARAPPVVNHDTLAHLIHLARAVEALKLNRVFMASPPFQKIGAGRLSSHAQIVGDEAIMAAIRDFAAVHGCIKLDRLLSSAVADNISYFVPLDPSSFFLFFGKALQI